MNNTVISEQTLYTRFDICNSLPECCNIDSNNFEIYKSDYGTLKYFSQTKKLTLNTAKGDYNLTICDNQQFKDYISPNNNIIDSAVLDDDSLLTSQRALNNAKMSFTYANYEIRPTKNADLVILKFASSEKSIEITLLTIIQIMCALFGDLDENIIEFFIDMSDYFFAGNYRKPGVNRLTLAVNDSIVIKNSYQMIVAYLQELYATQAVSCS